MPLPVLTADDEPSARRALRRLLLAEPDVDIVAECTSGEEAVAKIRELQPELVFLDVQMPGLDGFQVVEAIQDLPHPLAIIFVTAYDSYAARAFRVNATDYLLKPIEPEIFRAAMARARGELARAHEGAVESQLSEVLQTLNRVAGMARPASPAIVAEQPRYLDRIAVRAGERLIVVRATDVDWFEAAGNYVKLRTKTGVHQVRDTLTNLERQLDPSQFVRIHRQTIVNLDRIRELQPWFNGDFAVLLHDGSQVRLSRTYRSQLESALYSDSRRARG